MASFTSLLNDVYTITNRPDLIAETKLAVKQATLKMHQSDFYAKDLFETGIQWDPVGFIQSLAYKQLVPRWRKLSYLRKYSDGVPGTFFEVLSPENTLDRYSVNKDNICYVAGDQLELRSSTQDSYMLLGCYVHPDITESGYSSWIADEFPYAIILDAAATVFKTIGFDEQASSTRQSVLEQVMLIKQSNIG